MKTVFLISTGAIISGKTAGARRMIKIARSIAAGGASVYLCSLAEITNQQIQRKEIFPCVFSLINSTEKSLKQKSPIQFCKIVNGFMTGDKSETVVYLYPTTFVFNDFIYLFYFKYLKRYKVFCEINELRTAIAFSSLVPEGFLLKFCYLFKSIKDYLIFKLNEFQVILYDGIIVISTNLENYFSRYTKQISRIPILCDASEIVPDNLPGNFDGKVFKLCFAGYIKMDKEGFDLLFEVLFKLNQTSTVDLFLYGILEEKDKAKLGILTARYGLTGNIHYLGNLEPDKLKDEFVKYHLLILPRPVNKRTRYGFSTKLSEYLVSGLPVLVTDVSDNALYIKDGFNGFIIPPGSVEVMTNKLKEIMRHYNNQAHIIVENSYKLVREELDYNLFSQKYIDFLFSNNL
ncbi:MAG: glycosyltransferase family 4 protein [Bacteroidales bacterium]|nr:glycosyltransferase family 4 protein [Bacteroidales bacterium]